MNNKLVIGLLVILISAVSFLAVQNLKLNKKIEELSTANPEVKATPAPIETNPAKLTEASPFDKPNTDPSANVVEDPKSFSTNITSIQFEKTIHDFGRIEDGEMVRTVFKFTNTGKFPLLISSAQASCGCTVPRWPREPIRAGESGEIAVQFDSHGKRGETEKTVTVTANTNPTTVVLTIKSTIVPKDK
jgi:hypothetical protein